MFGTSYCNIQPAFAAVTIERAEIHGHPPGFIGSIADRKENHVPFVTLNIFQIFYKYGLTLNGWFVTEMDFNFGKFPSFFIK